MSENTPLIIRQLFYILKYNGKIHYGNQILLVTAPDIPSLDLHTKKYLKNTQSIRKRLPHKIHSYFNNKIPTII